MTTPFDFVASFSNKKEYLLNSPLDEADYVPFIVNKAMSFMPDTIFHANEVNKMWELDKKIQHDFYYYSVPKGKRFSKWEKKDNISEDVQLVSDFYLINNSKALKYLEILSGDQLEKIRDKMNKGGRHGR